MLLITKCWKSDVRPVCAWTSALGLQLDVTAVKLTVSCKPFFNQKSNP